MRGGPISGRLCLASCLLDVPNSGPWSACPRTQSPGRPWNSASGKFRGGTQALSSPPRLWPKTHPDGKTPFQNSCKFLLGPLAETVGCREGNRTREANRMRLICQLSSPMSRGPLWISLRSTRTSSELGDGGNGGERPQQVPCAPPFPATPVLCTTDGCTATLKGASVPLKVSP